MTVSGPVLVLQLVAALFALIGLAFVAKQSKVQANSQELESLIETDRRWVAATKSASVTLSAKTLSVIGKIYRLPGISATSCLPGDIDLKDVTKGAPYIMEFLLPSWEHPSTYEEEPSCSRQRRLEGTAKGQTDLNPPATEREYLEFALTHRASSALIVLDVLEQIRMGESTTIKALNLDHDSVSAVRDDFENLCKAMNGFVNDLNDIAEFFDFGLINRKAFLGKRHVSILRIAAAAEPYVLWKCVNDQSRWGLRVLSLGNAARAYHRRSKIQQGLIRFSFDPPEYPGLGTNIGPLFFAAESQNKTSRLGNAINTFVVRGAIGKSFSFSTKSRQNTTCRELRDVIRDDSEAATPKILQILNQLNSLGNAEVITSASSFSGMQQEVASALSSLYS